MGKPVEAVEAFRAARVLTPGSAEVKQGLAQAETMLRLNPSARGVRYAERKSRTGELAKRMLAVRGACLSGEDKAAVEKMTAARVAARVTGVKAVANELEVGLLHTDQRSDEDIARSVANALVSNTSIPPDRVKAQVSNGWVTLEGTVEWYYQKEAAERAVRPVRGVKGVTNSIMVKPTVTAAVVKAQIEAALKRSAEVDAQRITVETRGDTVILRGNVRSWAERHSLGRLDRATLETRREYDDDANLARPRCSRVARGFGCCFDGLVGFGHDDHP